MDQASLDPNRELADSFAAIARALSVPDDVDSVFRLVARSAVDVIDGCDHSAITVTERGRPRTAGASGDLPVAVDAIQYQTGQGPCLEAIKSAQTYEIPDLATDSRWPAFTERAVAETQIRSALSYRLYLDGRTLGALNLYAVQPNSFDDRDRQVGAIFAAHAAVALAAVDEVAHLRTALQSRDVISTAKGILMARQDISEDDAFDILRRASRRTNVKLRDLAERLVRPADETQPEVDEPDPAP